MTARAPRIFSERTFRWLLNLFPPLLFSRVKILEIGPGFRSCRVRVARSVLTRNLHGTTFGGAIFCGFDPIYPVLYWQAFARRGEALQVWLKAAEIDYCKPARTALHIEFAISESDLDQAQAGLDADGKVVVSHETEAVDSHGDTCARARCEVYMRRLRTGQREVSGF